jgi:DNA-binding GntR family transcriptional regulator
VAIDERSVPAVTRKSVSVQVADILRTMILRGELKSDEALVHDDLAKRLGVSTMPVREALLRLTHEGFVVAHHNRSFRVATTSKDDIQDLFWLYGLVAEELARRACRNAGPEIADELDALNRQWDERAQTGTEDYDRINSTFKHLINEAANSAKLVFLLGQIRRFIPENFYSVKPAWRKRWVAEHKKIATAMRRSDPDAAALVTRRYIQDAAEVLIDYFDDRGYWEPLADPASAV